MLAARAGVAYFALAFAVGFVLGVMRVVLVVPRLGPLGAVALELPVILAACWVICGRLLARYGVPSDVSSRVVMGGVAFGLLMLADAVLALGAFGNEPAAYLAEFGGADRALGLAGQLAFALFPIVQRRVDDG